MRSTIESMFVNVCKEENVSPEKVFFAFCFLLQYTVTKNQGNITSYVSRKENLEISGVCLKRVLSRFYKYCLLSFCSHKPKLKISMFFIGSYGSENHHIRKTSKTVEEELLNFLKYDNKLEELGIDVTADTVTDP